MNNDILYKDESYKIVGACFEVCREKGCGFLEPVYQECMQIELRLQGIPFVPKKPPRSNTKVARCFQPMSRILSVLKRSF
jgi:GxxExxY protein